MVATVFFYNIKMLLICLNFDKSKKIIIEKPKQVVFCWFFFSIKLIDIINFTWYTFCSSNCTFISPSPFDNLLHCILHFSSSFKRGRKLWDWKLSSNALKSWSFPSLLPFMSSNNLSLKQRLYLSPAHFTSKHLIFGLNDSMKN